MNKTPDNLPLIAILRGVTPANVVAYTEKIIDAGFYQVEVPLNSPDAFTSIALLAKTYQNDYLIGAGTVTTTEQANKAIASGAKLIVTPNYNADVIANVIKAGCICYCGIFTPTEAFNAIEAGASGLKIFPANMMGVSGFKALKSVLPSTVKCFPVGGIEANEQSMFGYLNAGATGFGLGSALYKSTMSLEEVAENAKKFVSVYRQFGK